MVPLNLSASSFHWNNYGVTTVFCHTSISLTSLRWVTSPSHTLPLAVHGQKAAIYSFCPNNPCNNSPYLINAIPGLGGGVNCLEVQLNPPSKLIIFTTILGKIEGRNVHTVQWIIHLLFYAHSTQGHRNWGAGGQSPPNIWHPILPSNPVKPPIKETFRTNIFPAWTL